MLFGSEHLECYSQEKPFERQSNRYCDARQNNRTVIDDEGLEQKILKNTYINGDGKNRLDYKISTLPVFPRVSQWR